MRDNAPDLSIVRLLKSKGRFAEAERQLKAWLEEDSDNPRLLFEVAVVLDNQGKEDQAIPYYERALSMELDVAHRPEAYIGLGSSLRTIGRIFESHQILSRALAEYPHHMALRVFYAMTLERMGNYGDAISQLMEVIAEAGKDESLDVFRPAIRYYRTHRYDGVDKESNHPSDG